MVYKKSRPTPKRERKKFVKGTKALLRSLGAKRGRFFTYDFVLETKVGKLFLSVTENSCNGLGTMFTRFDEPKRAIKLVPCNPHSGKWNHHYFGDGWDVKEVVLCLEQELKRMLP